ncbi:NUDIX hydrolase [Gilvimarinus polysaccharolyticus]|uniref:NUDIX hydrolase n=1 Tax=Gilvimarinus polysaccharolyticus TaxID=863921 RepID=UPI00067359ED|nr:CoA pyrophosphatase [Gilvimarinus polysaccharolyticus]
MSDARWRALVRQLQPLETLRQYCPTVGEAAVLVGLIERGDKVEVLLTERAAHLLNHPSEVAFPGGKFEPGDRDLIATALREAHEETALSPDRVALLGALPAIHTRAGVKVTAVVAQIAPGVALTADRSELNAIFYAPLALFQAARADYFDHIERAGVQYQTPAYCCAGYNIWGLTAVLATQVAGYFLVNTT